jgi:hypothetical protein
MLKTYEVQEGDCVSKLITRLEKTCGRGPWYLKFNQEFIFNINSYICTFLFRNPAVHFSASRTPLQPVIVQLALDDTLFKVISDRNPVTVDDLTKIVRFHFTVSSRLRRLAIGSKELTNPQELIPLDPSQPVEVHTGYASSQKIHMVFDVTKEEQVFRHSLFAPINDLMKRLGRPCHFSINGKATFDNPTQLLRTYVRYPWPNTVHFPPPVCQNPDKMISSPSQTVNPQPPCDATASQKISNSPSQSPVLPTGERPAAVPIDTQRPSMPIVTSTNVGPAAVRRPSQSGVPSGDAALSQNVDRPNPIECNLILPPDGQVVNETCDEKASVSDAIDRTRFYLQKMSVLRILDGESKVLIRDTLLCDLAAPRDLFVQECVIYEVGRRSGVDFHVECAEVPVLGLSVIFRVVLVLTRHYSDFRIDLAKFYHWKRKLWTQIFLLLLFLPHRFE